MNRRLFLTLLAALSGSDRVARAENPNQLRLLFGGFDGKIYSLGLKVNLAEGWKTYWRVPGDGGIPPQISITGENVASVAVSLPAPHRFSDASGESIGYKDQVVFLIDVMPKDASAPISAAFDAFLGVCKEICIPAPLKQDLMLDPMTGEGADAFEFNDWRTRMPQVSTEPFPVQSLTLAPDGATITLSLAAPVDDIFVETEDGLPLYFKQPTFSGNTAVIEVAGVKSPGDLKGRKLRMTIVTKTASLEQRLTVG